MAPAPRRRSFKVGGVRIGGPELFLIAGPCVVESATHPLRVAERLKRVTRKLGIGLIFKASYDKANRSSPNSYRGPGMERGLEILAGVKEKLGLPILTDVHEPGQVEKAAQVADILQIPAFLCRQTDLVMAAAESGRAVNIKKGQFMAPWDMKGVLAKAARTGNDRLLVTERGFSFGYNNLISDMRSLAVMRGTGAPVVFDATHSVQQPGGLGSSSGGRREFIPVLARAAAAAGVAGFFMETHPDPSKALSDGPNAWPLDKMKQLLETLMSIDSSVKQSAYLEADYGLGVPDSPENME